jgi:hypothetical protein
MARHLKLKPGDLYEVQLAQDLRAYFVVFFKSGSHTVYGGFFKDVPTSEELEFPRILSSCALYCYADTRGIEEGRWITAGTLELPPGFRPPPMRLVQKKKQGQIEVRLIDSETWSSIECPRELADLLEDAAMETGHLAAERIARLRITGIKPRPIMQDFETAQNIDDLRGYSQSTKIGLSSKCFPVGSSYVEREDRGHR